MSPGPTAKQLAALQKAQQALALRRAKGIKSRRVSRLPALQCYYRDFYGVDQNKRDPGQPSLCYQDYKLRMTELRGQKLGAVVAEICFDCVGGDDDPGPKLRVRDCPCGDCPLHSVRPWQTLKGRGSVKDRS